MASETNYRLVSTHKGRVAQVLPTYGGQAGAKGVDLAIEPTMPPKAAKDEPSALSFDQNRSGIAPTPPDPAEPVHEDREERLIQLSQTAQQKSPKEKELDAKVIESEAQSSYIDQRLPRKRQGSKAAIDEPNSISFDENHNGLAPIIPDTVEPIRADHEYHEEGLSDIQFLQTGPQKLPRKKKSDADIIESEAHSSCLDQERMPRKRQGSEEPEVEARSLYARLPRKREDDESNNRRCG
ncbi:hypothetical protein OG21DRAFT_921141 [Imleria badia]|jgi:hypothetical protein|nr:hypothetical protein OG21DRAFT_921141 [Imleria badia]